MLKAIFSILVQTANKAKYVIDCDAPPFVPSGFKLEKHTKGGQLEWNSARILLLDERHGVDGGIVISKLLQRLAKLVGKRIPNANVLDFLLAHPELIPEKWKGKTICFYDTVYRDTFDDSPCVRCLYWNGSGWRCYCHWLDFFDSYHPERITINP